jgi:hypothetical protein
MQTNDSSEAVENPFDPSFTEITHNFYGPGVKRKKKEEVSVCTCIPQENKPGCGITCISRRVQVECNPDSCPCKDKCANQRFQRRQYPKLEVFRAGEKGYGIRTKEQLSRGQFIIEYVGEIIDTASCLKRMQQSGQRHFYFITLEGNEGIDATFHGNIARFINHSCDPNCETQKWSVRGDNCVGIFAKEDIRPNTELTFDYMFVRAGNQKQQCLCGSENCRGFLDAKPLTKQPRNLNKHKFAKHNVHIRKITKDYPHYLAVQKSMRQAPFINDRPNAVEGSTRPIFLKRNYRGQKTLVLENFGYMIDRSVQKHRAERAEAENKRAKARNNRNHYLMNLDIEQLISKGLIQVDPTPLPSKKRNND